MNQAKIRFFGRVVDSIFVTMVCMSLYAVGVYFLIGEGAWYTASLLAGAAVIHAYEGVKAARKGERAFEESPARPAI